MCEKKANLWIINFSFLILAHFFERIAICSCARSLKLGLELENMNKTNEIPLSLSHFVIVSINSGALGPLNDTKRVFPHKIRMQVIYFVWKLLYFLMTALNYFINCKLLTLHQHKYTKTLRENEEKNKIKP